MPRRKWTITTHVSGIQREVELVLYDTPAILRREATRWANHIGQADNDYRDAVGVCHGFDRIKIGSDGTETRHPLAAIIRLQRQNLTTLVIAHEVAHAAQHLYGLDVLGYDNTDLARDHYDAGNEPFAHLYGELFAAVWGAVGQAVD